MRSFILLCSVLIAATSCKKKLTEFNIDYNSEIVVQSTIGQLVPVSLYTPEIETNSKYEFESNDTDKDHVESVRLQGLTLTITSPSNETFSFLNSVEIYISSPNISEQKVAFKENIDANAGTSLVCDIADLELQDYIQEDRFTLRVLTVSDETIPQDVHIEVYTNFFVKAKLLK